MKARVDRCRSAGTLDAIANSSNTRAERDEPQEDDSFWLVPMEDRRKTPESSGARRAGITDRMNLASYLQLLDWSGRLLRRGKARIPKEVAGILDRLGSSVELWQHRLEKLRGRSDVFGTVFATSRTEINRMAEVRGVKKLSNLNGCSS